jgi:anti-sigma regulatory factor (Ser/Thr protein kinase)
MSAMSFCHEVTFYEDEGEFLETAVPFVRRGLEAGEPILVAVGTGKIELLEGELGANAAEVRFVDMVELGRNPAHIIPAWRDFLDTNLEPGRGVRGIGEPIWAGRSEAELDECCRHEWLLNVAFGDGPAWSLLCPYDSRALDDGVLEAARENHPHLRRSGTSGSCAEWTGVEAFAPFAGSLPAPPPDARTLTFGREDLKAARALVGGEARSAGLSDDRAADLAIAGGELVANSIRHGGGSGMLRAWQEADAMVVEVEDRGRVQEPLIGRLRPTVEQEGGRGLWMANQLCDLVQIRSDSERTAIRLRMGLS